MSRYYYITPEDYSKAAQNGISATTLEARVRNLGWNVERAIKTPPQARTDFKDWPKIAQQNGICRWTFRNRISLGWDPERAATQPVVSRSKNMSVLGKKNRIFPKSLLELAQSNGISSHTFGDRVRRGWDPTKAATTPLMVHK